MKKLGIAVWDEHDMQDAFERGETWGYVGRMLEEAMYRYFRHGKTHRSNLDIDLKFSVIDRNYELACMYLLASGEEMDA